MALMYRNDYPVELKSWTFLNSKFPHRQYWSEDCTELLRKAVGMVHDEGEDSELWAVEFGAFDGGRHSHLHKMKNQDMNIVYIEGDPDRYLNVKKNNEGNERVHAFCGKVGWSASDSVDYYLSRTPIPENFDFMIVDVDGNDYHIVEALKQYRPKLMMVEINPSIPNNVFYVQDKDENVANGSSLLAIRGLMKEKGYTLIGTLGGFDALFVVNELASEFVSADFPINDLHNDSYFKMVYFQLHDGTIKNAGHSRLMWNGVAIDDEDIQIIPKKLRRYGITKCSITNEQRHMPEFIEDTQTLFSSYHGLRLYKKDIDEKLSVLVWGAGSRFEEFLDTFGDEIGGLTLVDSNTGLQGKSVHGYAVAAPEDVDIESFDVVVVCSVFFFEIVTRMHELGFDFEVLSRKLRYFDPEFAV